MNNLLKVALITGATAFGFILLFIGFDTACLGSGAIQCRVWRAFQWESVIAGALGLAGGLFVIASTRQQINAVREDMAAEHLKDVDALWSKCQEITANIGNYLEGKDHLSEDDDFTAWRPAINEWDPIRTSRPSARILAKIRDNDYISSGIKAECRKIDELAGKHSQTVFTAPSYMQILRNIHALQEEWTARTQALQEERNHQATFLMRR